MSERKIYYNLLTAHQQLFCFPPDVIKYMIKNCNALTWLKLIKSCKYFYGRHKACILKDVILKEEGILAANDINSFYRCWNKKCDCNYFLIEKFSIYSTLEVIKPKIYKCLLRHLCIAGADIVYEDFKFLTGSKLLTEFEIRNSKIVYSDGKIVQLEDIFAALPYVTSFIHESTKHADKNNFINSQTFRQMSEIPRHRMLKTFELGDIPRNANAEDFVLFVKYQVDNNCKVNLTFGFDDTRHFKNIIYQILNHWQPILTAPDIKCYNRFGQLHEDSRIHELNNLLYLQQRQVVNDWVRGNR